MARQRSPNYPARDLEDAIKDVQALYDKEKRGTVPPEVAVKAWGYKGASGMARVRLAALRQYGLIDWERKNVRVSDRALTLAIRDPGSREYQTALSAAALSPGIFRNLYETHAEVSDDALRHHLIGERNFTPDGATKLISAFRATLDFAKLDSRGYTKRDDEGTDEEEDDMDDGRDGEGATALSYRWQLSPSVFANLRLTGGAVTEADLDMLTDYLDLLKKAVTRQAAKPKAAQSDQKDSG